MVTFSMPCWWHWRSLLSSHGAISPQGEPEAVLAIAPSQDEGASSQVCCVGSHIASVVVLLLGALQCWLSQQSRYARVHTHVAEAHANHMHHYITHAHTCTHARAHACEHAHCFTELITMLQRKPSSLGYTFLRAEYFKINRLAFDSEDTGTE